MNYLYIICVVIIQIIYGSVMTKEEWLFRLRRCRSAEALEKIIDRNRHSLSDDDLEHFNSAADHRLAELAMGRLYDRIPPGVWKYVI